MKISIRWIAAQRFCSAAASRSFCFPEVNTVDMRPPIWLVWMMAFLDIPLYLVTAERFILDVNGAKHVASWLKQAEHECVGLVLVKGDRDPIVVYTMFDLL